MNHGSENFPAVRVSVIEDDAAIRGGIAALIQRSPGLSECGVYRSMEEALTGLQTGNPDVVLVDLGLPGMSGIEGICEMQIRWPHVCFIVLTIHEDSDQIMRALCAGANGYLLKNMAPELLVRSIHEAAAGGSPMSPEVARKVVTLFRRVQPPAYCSYDLTPHERRILSLLVDGENYKTAAAKLGVSVNTVSFHVRRIYEKLHVHSRSAAVVKALRAGLLK